jgi:hypothetical protein
MARRRRLTNLKRSFVVTISAVAAGASGCSDAHVRGSDMPSYAGAGGSGGADGGGAGGVGGQMPSPNPPYAIIDCPVDQPRAGDACSMPTATLGGCSYEIHDPNFCTGEPDFVLATCEQNLWVLDTLITTCNPPENPEIDSGLADEDAGN